MCSKQDYFSIDIQNIFTVVKGLISNEKASSEYMTIRQDMGRFAVKTAILQRKPVVKLDHKHIFRMILK